MGKRYIEHSGMCGCNRCAVQAESNFPVQIFDEVEDPDYLDCGCHAMNGCSCGYWDSYEDEDF